MAVLEASSQQEEATDSEPGDAKPCGRFCQDLGSVTLRDKVKLVLRTVPSQAEPLLQLYRDRYRDVQIQRCTEMDTEMDRGILCSEEFSG